MTIPLINLAELEDLLFPLAEVWLPEDNPKNEPLDDGFCTTVTLHFCLGSLRTARRIHASLLAAKAPEAVF